MVEKLLEEFKKRFEEQKEGIKEETNGLEPEGLLIWKLWSESEGIRVGGSRRVVAVKVWEQRQYKNLDDSLVIGTRNIKMALRRLRKFVRQSNNLELDMPNN